MCEGVAMSGLCVCEEVCYAVINQTTGGANL